MEYIFWKEHVLTQIFAFPAFLEQHFQMGRVSVANYIYFLGVLDMKYWAPLTQKQFFRKLSRFRRLKILIQNSSTIAIDSNLIVPTRGRRRSAPLLRRASGGSARCPAGAEADSSEAAEALAAPPRRPTTPGSADCRCSGTAWALWSGPV